MAGDALLGREMGRYRIESIIGSGGFATVYRAIDLALERPIALKVVDPTAHRNPTIGRRFVLEGRAVASLDHPAIVPVYDAGESDGVLWMAMRLITGGSLDDALVAGRRFTFEQVAAVAARIGDALDHAHGHGIVHRDVKPSNILLEQNDPARAWLADFGIAATTRTAGRYTTGALGTAAYMAPEQARPSSVGPPADLYSLGCVTYELLTRRRPFPGDDYVELLVAHATHPVPPTVWPRVDEFLQRALAKDPADRPPSGRAFAEELRRTLIATQRTRPAPPPSPASPAARAQPDAAAAHASPAAEAGAVGVGVASSPAPADAEPGTGDVEAGAADHAPRSGPDPIPAAGDAAAQQAPAGGAGPQPGRPPAPPPYRPGDPVRTAARSAAPEGEGAATGPSPKTPDPDEPRPAAAKDLDAASEPDATQPVATAQPVPAAGSPNPAPAVDVPDRAGAGSLHDDDNVVAAPANGRPAAPAGTRPPPPRRDEPPTVVEHVNKTLEHPQLRPPPPPAGPPPGWTGPAHRSPPPASPPGGVRPPPPAPPAPRDPTVVRSGRQRGRRRLIAGGALLVIGIVAVAVALLEQQRNGDDERPVDDPAGIRYEVPADWEPDTSQAPLVVFELDDARTATIIHVPTDGDRSATEQLADGADRDVCEGEPAEGPTIAGADQVAECRNTSPDLPQRAIGAIAHGLFWVITVEQATDEADGNDLVDSIELTTPG